MTAAGRSSPAHHPEPTMSKIDVSQKVLDQLELVRQGGRTNMLDRNMVQVIANEQEFYDLVCWIADHEKQYGKMIFRHEDINVTDACAVCGGFGTVEIEADHDGSPASY